MSRLPSAIGRVVLSLFGQHGPSGPTVSMTGGALQSYRLFMAALEENKERKKSWRTAQASRQATVYSSWEAGLGEASLGTSTTDSSESQRVIKEAALQSFGSHGMSSSDKDSPCKLLPAAGTPDASKKQQKKKNKRESLTSLATPNEKRVDDGSTKDNADLDGRSSDTNSVEFEELLETVSSWGDPPEDSSKVDTDTFTNTKKLFEDDDSAPPSSGVTYAVFIGREPGLYSSWDEARGKVDRYPNGLCRKFKTRSEAAAAFNSYMSQNQPEDSKEASTPQKNEAVKPRQAQSVSSSLADDVRSCETTPVKRGYSKIILQFDGGSRGNPGPSGAGAVLMDEHRSVLLEVIMYIGHATNNIAEYNALISGLEQAVKLKPNCLIVEGDSKLVCDQVEGNIKCNNETLKALRDKARRLFSSISQTKLIHIRRAMNQAADKLANEAMDRKLSEVRILVSGSDPETPEIEPEKRKPILQLSQSPLDKKSGV